MSGQQKPSNDPCSNQYNPGTPIVGYRYRTNGTCRHQHSPSTPTTGLRERGNNTSRSTGRSSRQNAATRRSMRREERVTVQGPVKKQQPDGMSHRGAGIGEIGSGEVWRNKIVPNFAMVSKKSCQISLHRISPFLSSTTSRSSFGPCVTEH